MDDNDDYFKIGEQLLTRHMNSISISDTEDDNDSFKENEGINENFKLERLNAKCHIIYHFFLNNGISSFLQPMTQNLKDRLESEISNLQEILEADGKYPSITNFQKSITDSNRCDKCSEFFSYFNALNILSFALLLIKNNEKLDTQKFDNKKDVSSLYNELLDSRSDEIVQYEQLKEKYKRLLAKLKEYESFFTLLARKMNLPDNTDFNTIASKLALTNLSNTDIQYDYLQDNKLKRYLTSKFNLSNDLSIDEIIRKVETQFTLFNNIKTETEENDISVKKFFTQMMDMPENSDDNDVKIKLGSIFEENQSMKNEINFLNGKIAKQKKQNQEILSELDNIKKPHVSFDINKSTSNIPQREKVKTKSPENDDDQEGAHPKIYILQTEIESLKVSLQNLREKSKTVREQNKLLKKISKEAINETRSKANTITELTIKINDLTLQNSELERSLEEQKKRISSNESKNSTGQNFSECFDYLSSQIESQSNELSQISENRNYLYKIINKQEKVIDFLCNQVLQREKNKDRPNEEQKASKSVDKIMELNEIQLLEKHLISLAEESKRADIVTMLTSSDSQEENENEPLNSILSTFSFLLNNSEKVEEEKNLDNSSKSSEKVDFSSFKEVCVYLSSLLVFFDKIANSSDAIDWIFSNNYFMDNQSLIGLNLNPYLDTGKTAIKETLMNLVQRLTCFLEDKRIDFMAPDFLHITESLFAKTQKKAKSENTNEKEKPSDSDFSIDSSDITDTNEDDESFVIDEKSALEQQRIFVILTVADVLKNYSLRLEERVDELGINLQEIKDELLQAEMVANDSKSLLESERQKNLKLLDELENLQSKMKSEKQHKNHRKEVETETTIEATEMFTANDNATNGLNNDSTRFCCVNQTISKDDENDKKKFQRLFKLMKKKFEKILKEQEKKINVLSDKLIDTQNELESNKEVNDQISKENKELTETIAVMTERLSQFEIEKDEAVTSRTAKIESDYEEKLSKQKKLNKKLLDDLDEMRKKVELAEDTQNIENKNLENENKELFTKIEVIKANYETLIESYKQKYSDFQEREKKLADENANQTESLKKLNKELNDARIESKISALKNKTLNEKFERQESLHQVKITAMATNFETSLNEKLKRAEIDHENRQKKFLKQLVEELKDFYDFSHSMSEENCLKTVSRIVSQLKEATSKEKQLKKSTETLDEMKSGLNVKSDNELITKVFLLSSLSSVNGQNDSEIENEKIINLRGKMVEFESSLKNWRRWANCMNLVLSDNFSSFSSTSTVLAASVKDMAQRGPNSIENDPRFDSELRSKIEEKILSTVGRRRIFRRIEILRNEKIVFLKLLNEFGSLDQVIQNDRNIGLQTLICVVISMRRIQKISGKLPSISIGSGFSGKIALTSGGSNGSSSAQSNNFYRYNLDDRNSYHCYDNSNYDDTYEKGSNSQYQQKKKPPIISCT